MAYTPSTLTIDDWTVPISIAASDTIASLDNTVNAIIDTDADSAKVHINTELAKLPTYFTTEFNAIYSGIGDDIDVLTGLTVSSAELNILDGATLDTAELNLLDGVTSTTAELNILDGVTATTAELNIMDGVTATATEINLLDGVTATTAELNIMDGVTATTAELNKLDGYTGSVTELNYLKTLYDTGVTNTEFDYLDGVTSAIQTQFGLKSPLASPTFTGTVTLPTNTVIDLVADTTPQLGGDLDFNGKTMNESAVRQITDASLGTGTYTFDYETGDMVQLTATGDITLAVDHFPSGDVAGYIVDCVNFGAHTITHPAAWFFHNKTAPTYTTSGTDRILLASDKDGIITLTIIAQDVGTV